MTIEVEVADAPLVHPTAVVERGAQIGPRTRIWHFAHVMPGARIGADCVVGHACYVGDVTIGDRCRIQNHVSVFDGVTLEDEVLLGPSCVFTNVKHPRAHVSRKEELEPTRVGRGATIGANATVVCGVTIGAYAFIGAGAAVASDVQPHALVVGVPARWIGWACRCGERLPGFGGTGLSTCVRCGDRYRSVGAGIERLVTRLALLLLLAASCSRSGGGGAPRPAAPADATVSTAPASTDAADDEAQRRADCEQVLAHTWNLMGGDPDSDKLKGARHERELAECAAHLTPAARDCVLAATRADQIEPCESLAR